MYRDRLRISAHIADIHIGVHTITAEEIKYQLYERFIKPLSELAILDLITVNGDVSHLSLSFNSKLAEVYIWFFDSIVSIAKKKNAAIIVVQGTLSHEYDQLDNVKVYQSSVEMYFASEPMVVETKGMRIYCLPDIHIKNKEDESKLYSFPDGHFDMVLGHGSITETQFIKQESEHAISKNIVYESKQLVRICKGPILFGHIHSPMKFLGRIFYINSFTRYIHGEEADKGWMLTAYIPETAQFIAERVINDLAFNFNIFTVSHQLFDKLDADELVKKIDKFVKEYKVDRLCLELNYMATDANIAKIQILRNYYSRDKHVNKLKIKALSKKEAQLIEQNERQIEENKKSYLTDKSLTFEEKLQRFIEEEYNVKVPISKLHTVFTSDDLLIREGVSSVR